MNDSKTVAEVKNGGQRSSNLELFRILSMLSIIAHHFVVNSGITVNWSPIYEDAMSWRSLFMELFGAWGKVGIDCFVLVTGYFMCKKQISIRKFFRLIFEVIFYNVVIYLIFLHYGYETLSFDRVCNLLTPIKNIDNGFISCYLVFYLFIPFINILIHHMTKKQHLWLICLLIFVYSVLGSVKYLTVTINLVSWFLVIYLVAAFVRIYDQPIFHENKLMGVLLLLSFGLACVSIISSMHYIDIHNEGTSIYWYVNDANKILALTTSLAAFMFFRNLKLPQIGAINSFAYSAFGVLCIHANSDVMREWLWKDVVDVRGGVFHSRYLPMIAFGWVIFIYFVCALIDMARIRLIEKPMARVIDRAIERGVVKKIYDRVDKVFQARI